MRLLQRCSNSRVMLVAACTVAFLVGTALFSSVAGGSVSRYSGPESSNPSNTLSTGANRGLSDPRLAADWARVRSRFTNQRDAGIQARSGGLSMVNMGELSPVSRITDVVLPGKPEVDVH